MKKEKTRVFLTVILCVLLVVALCGVCGAAEYEDELIDGGTTTRVDLNAPKEIESVEITQFDASFCLFTRWKTDSEDDFFHFVIRNDEQGILMASEEILCISNPADHDLLSALQEVIEQNDLVKMNGIYDVTAGLSPEYAEGGLTVQYASGETLKFTTDNNPYALWAEQVYDVFAEWFVKQGDDSLYPPKEDSPVTYLRLEWTEQGICLRYGGVNVPDDAAIDGETYLLCMHAYDTVTLEDIVDEYVLFPDDYYEMITQILAGYEELVRNYDFSRYDRDSGLYDMHDLGYYGMGGLTPADGEEDSEDRNMSLHIQYESGRTINIDTAKESEIEAIRPLIEELQQYLDPIFFPELVINEDEQFSIIINEPSEPEYSYLRCDYYLGDVQFGYFLGCPDEGDAFTHFDLTADCFEGIEGDHELSTFHAEISLGYNGSSGVDALMQVMMGNEGDREHLASLQFSPEYGTRYEYNLISTEDGYQLEEKK